MEAGARGQVQLAISQETEVLRLTSAVVDDIAFDQVQRGGKTSQNLNS
jgi:hypothetical protein